MDRNARSSRRTDGKAVYKAVEGSLGIVVIGRNEGERLRRCLASVPDGLPIVYVDSGSTDGSVTVANHRGAMVVELDMSEPFTAARGRAEGLARLLEESPSSRFVQFVDGDCEFEHGWLENALRFLDDNPTVAAVCGRRRELRPDASFYNRLCDEEWDTPIGPADACGGDALVRVGALQQVGGFNPSIVAGEEPELCWRLRKAGWQIWRLDAPMTVHDAAMFRFGQWWRRAWRSGYGYAQVWHQTAGPGAKRLYGKELGRAAFWTLGVAGAGIAAMLATGPAGVLLAPLIWLFQLARLTVRFDWRKATHLLLGKLAELLGATSYAITAVRGKKRGAMFYK